MKISHISVSTGKTKEGWLYDQGAIVIDGLWFYQDVSSEESVDKLKKLADSHGIEFLDKRSKTNDQP